MPDLAAWRDPIVRGVEIAGVLVILCGGIAATARFVSTWRTHTLAMAYQEYRRNLGRAILLGLEFLVAADIINTVAVNPTFESVGVLAGIVAIRTFLSVSLEVEIDGQWPWRRSDATRTLPKSCVDEERP